MYQPEGNGTEIALLRMLTDNDFAIQDLFAHKSRNTVALTNIPFGPIRKRQVVVFKPSEESQQVRIIVKGAPEYVLPMCTQQLASDGTVEDLEGAERDRILH